MIYVVHDQSYHQPLREREREMTLLSPARATLAVRDVHKMVLTLPFLIPILRLPCHFSCFPINSPLQNFKSLQSLPDNPVVPLNFPAADNAIRPSVDTAILSKTQGEILELGVYKWFPCFYEGMQGSWEAEFAYMEIMGHILLDDLSLLSKFNCVHQFCFVFMWPFKKYAFTGKALILVCNCYQNLRCMLFCTVFF